MAYTIMGSIVILVIGILLIIFGSLGRFLKWAGIILTILSAGYLAFMLLLPPF